MKYNRPPDITVGVLTDVAAITIGSRPSVEVFPVVLGWKISAAPLAISDVGQSPGQN